VSEELIASGRVVRPWLGIRIETLGENAGLQQMMGIDKGVLVRTIEPDAPAARSELQPADVIVAVDGEPVSTARDLQQVILRKRVGQEVGLKVWRRGLREGAFREIKVTTDELPQSPLIASGGRTAPPRAERRGDEEGGDGSFGLRIQDIPEAAAAQMGLSAPGVIVTGVEEGSPADLAGLREKDVITAVGSTAVRDTEAFAAAMQDLGDSAAVLLLEREGKKTYAILKP
jgi:S1-C subfamily serine protease